MLNHWKELELAHLYGDGAQVLNLLRGARALLWFRQEDGSFEAAICDAIVHKRLLTRDAMEPYFEVALQTLGVRPAAQSYKQVPPETGLHYFADEPGYLHHYAIEAESMARLADAGARFPGHLDYKTSLSWAEKLEKAVQGIARRERF